MIKFIIPIAFIIFAFLALKHFNKLSIKNMLIFIAIELTVLGIILSITSINKKLKSSSEDMVIELSEIHYELDSNHVLAARFYAQNLSERDIANINFKLDIQHCPESSSQSSIENHQEQCKTTDSLQQNVQAHLKTQEKEFFTVRFKRNSYKNIAEEDNIQFDKSNQFQLSVSNFTYY